MQAKAIYFSYHQEEQLIENLSVHIKEGIVTTIIGPNGSGKSTLLGLLTRMYHLQKGSIFINNKNIETFKQNELAKKIAIVHQNNVVDSEITVEKLVSYGRNPYLGTFDPLGEDDYRIIDEALKTTGLYEVKERSIGEISGGQRQRAWIAMSLCQNTDILFLDEPTNSLDIYYQIETLEFVKQLNRKKGITIIMVLHDINQALGYSDEIIVMKNGKIYKKGKPLEIINEALMKEVYHVKGRIVKDNETGSHYVVTDKFNE
ncbi:MAG: ABC transporter ATP-binding protein [Clostridia bacterium]|nr:ABC transporter ATP-binding protein [Clostridia bacterium]